MTLSDAQVPAMDAGGRVHWLDVCRIAALFGVVLIHVAAPFFYQYGYLPTGQWLWANGFDSLSRAAVPLFVMLSGALLLNSQSLAAGPWQFIARRAIRIGLPLLSWSLVYALWQAMNGAPEALSWAGVAGIASGPTVYHLWFPYMLLGVYLLAPMLRSILDSTLWTSVSVAEYMLAIWLAANVLSPFLVTLPAAYQLGGVLGYGGYFLLGAYLLRIPDTRLPGRLASVGLYMAGFLTTFGVTWWRCSASGGADETWFQYFSPGVFLMAIGAFLFGRTGLPANFGAGPWVSRISQAAYAGYLAHVLVIELVKRVMGSLGVDLYTLSPALVVPVLALTVCGASLALGVALGRQALLSRLFC